jgi:hypothetical protein
MIGKKNYVSSDVGNQSIISEVFKTVIKWQKKKKIMFPSM